MTSTPPHQLEDEDDSFSLDPDAAPILCVAEIQKEVRARLSAIKTCCCFEGMELAEMAHVHLAAPEAATRRAIMRLGVNTRADALGALSVIESDVDADLCARLIAGLREFIAAR
jgi:hypothetical protein